MITACIPLLAIILQNSTVVVLSKRRFGECIPITIMCDAFVLYFSQLLFHTYTPGIVIATVIAFAAIPLLFLNKERVRGGIFSPGFFVFLAICIFVLLWDVNRSFSIFDEFYHWGVMVKESLRLDQFYSVPESRLCIHKDYPPFLTMMELFWCKLAGGYSEGLVSASVHVFIISTLLLPVYEEVFEQKKERRPVYWMLTGFLAVLFILTVVFTLDPYTPRVVTSILADIFVPVLFAYSMYLLYKREPVRSWFGFIALVVSNTAIIMTKQVGIGFLMVIVFYGIVSEIFVHRDTRENSVFPGRNTLKNSIRYIISFVIPLANSFIWTAYIKRLGITGQFDLSNISLHDFFLALTGREQGLRHETIKSYIQALFQRPIGTVDWFPVTFASSLLIVFLILFLIWRIGDKKEFSVRNAVTLGAAFTCCTGGYAAVMMVLYAFCFNDVEMRELASYERYMSSYVLGEILVLLFIAIREIQKKWNVFASIRAMMILTAGCMVLLNPANMIYLCPQFIRGNKRAVYENDAAFVSEKTDPGASVYTIYDPAKIWPDWYGGYQVYLIYFTYDRMFPRERNAWTSDWTDEETRQDLLRIIDSNDFVYLKDCNEQMAAVLSDYTKDGTIKAGEVYEVIHDKNGMHLALR